MEMRHERPAADERSRRDASLGPDHLWGLLAAEPGRQSGAEWLLDWIETRREDRA
ncbi:MAG: hypothetical protein R3D46_15850 [Defluviimonas denitrificans]